MQHYDCIVIGGGFGGIAFAILNAMTGKKTALFECQPQLGGYGHSFENNGYQFCANMHYFFDTEANGLLDQFLKKINLKEKIHFNTLDKNRFDVVQIDDYRFEIPGDLKLYQQKLITEFPESKAAIDKLFNVRADIELIAELYSAQHQSFLSNIIDHPKAFLIFSKYFLRSSSKVLDELQIHGRLRAILLARVGNFAMLSTDVPLMFLLLEMTYYTRSATYPEKGMGHFVQKLQEKLIQLGCDIYLNTEITSVTLESNKINSVSDQQGNQYTAELYVSDIDPQQFWQLSGRIPTKKYRYQYTYSCFSLYIGLKNIDLAEHHLGNFNVWYLPSLEVDADCQQTLENLDYQKSFMFIATPSAHVAPGVLAKFGGHTMQIVLPADYHRIQALYAKDQGAYLALVEAIKKQVLALLAKKFIKNIENYIESLVIWSPVDLAQHIKTPCGALYGMRADKRKIIRPIGHYSPIEGLYFVGASASHPGLVPVIHGAMNLFDQLQTTN